MPSFESKFLKKQFAPYELDLMADREAPIWGYVDKVRSGGTPIAEGVILKGNNNNAGDFRTAQALASEAPVTYLYRNQGAGITINNTGFGASNYDEFSSGFGAYFGVATITAFAKAAGQNNKDAYLRQLDEITSSEIKSYLSIAARKYLGPVGGSIGQVTAIAANAVAGNYTLARPTDAYNFAVGQVVFLATTNGDGSPATVRGGANPTPVYIVGVTPDADSAAFVGGHVQVTSVAQTTTPAAVATVAANDFIFRAGDILQGTDLSDRQIRSLQSWITLAAATDTKFGVARGQDARLSGFRVPSANVSGMSLLDRLQLLATVGRAYSNATMAKLSVMGPHAAQQLTSEAQSYGTLKFTKNERIGIDIPTVMTQNGDTMVLSEPHCVSDDLWLLTPDDLKLYHSDGFPALDVGDGNEILRQANDSGYEIRWHSFTCPTVNGKPWRQGRTTTGITQ